MVGGGGAWAVMRLRLGLGQGLHLAYGLGRCGSCNMGRGAQRKVSNKMDS